MPYRCRDCRKRFSVRVGTVMEDSKLGYQVWVVAIYLLTTGIKGVSSMKLHRDFATTQKSAWYLAHLIRETWQTKADAFTSLVEVNETYISGKEKNKYSRKKLRAGRGPVGKAAVAGAKDRHTNRIHAKVVSETSRATLRGFVRENGADGGAVFTDSTSAYHGMASYEHEAVTHSVREYVRGMAHTNEIESSGRCST